MIFDAVKRGTVGMYCQFSLRGVSRGEEIQTNAIIMVVIIEV